MMGSALSARLEDYLEAILHVVEAKGAARPKEIIRELKIGASSVTAALKSLAAKDLVDYAPYDVVTLTESGEKIARDVAHRHETIRRFLIRVLDADRNLADEAACQMKHAVPKELCRSIRALSIDI